jgi:hypothetical protein
MPLLLVFFVAVEEVSLEAKVFKDLQLVKATSTTSAKKVFVFS